MRKPVFTETLQVAMVVRDLDATMRTYVEEYGIGPWDIYEFNPETVQQMVAEGQPAEHASRVAVTMVGSVQWELIQPLDDKSIYAEFLREHGEGLHHLGVAVADYRDALAELQAKGNRILYGGLYKGIEFAYLSTDGDLKTITEVFSGAPGADQKPDSIYPPPDGS